MKKKNKKKKDKIARCLKRIEKTKKRIAHWNEVLSGDTNNKIAKRALRSLTKTLSARESFLKFLERGPSRTSQTLLGREEMMGQIGFSNLETLRKTFGVSAKYIDYTQYISSDDWVKRRHDYYLTHKRLCRSCGSKERTIHLHHRTYDRLGSEIDDDLIPMCVHCHENLHFIQRLFKLTTEAATAAWFTTINISMAKSIKDVRAKLRSHTSDEFSQVVSDRPTAVACIMETIGRLHKAEKSINKQPIDEQKVRLLSARAKSTGNINSYDKLIDSWIKKAVRG